MSKQASKKRFWAGAWLLIGTSLILSLITVFGLAAKYAPDELMRYEVAEFIFNNSSLPRGDEEVLRTVWGFNYSFEPYLPTIIGALCMKVTALFTSDSWLLYASYRLPSAMALAGMGIFSAFLSRRLFEKTGVQLLFVAITLFLPQVLYMSGYLNNDLFSVFLGYGIVLCWKKGWDEGWSWPVCTGLAVLLGALLLTYYYAYAYVLASIFFFLYSDWIQEENKKQFWLKTGWIVLVTFMIAGWFFIKNALFVPWDFFGFKATELYTKLYAIPELASRFEEGSLSSAISLWDMLVNSGPVIFGRSEVAPWYLMTLFSYIGMFRCMEVLMNINIYKGYCLFFAPGILAAVYWIGQAVRQKKQTAMFVFCMGLCLLVPVALSIGYSYLSDYQPQGRYLISNLCPFAALAAKGWGMLETWLGTWLRRLLKGRLPQISLCAVMAFVFALAGGFLYLYYNQTILFEMWPAALEAIAGV